LSEQYRALNFQLKNKNLNEKVYVWDIGIRLFHGFLIVLLLVSWWTGKEGGLYLEYHFWSGYSILTLIVFRVIWGFVGSTTARFDYFIRSPRTVMYFFKDLLRREKYEGLSHNPAGSYMVVVLIVILFVQVMTGLFSDDEIFNEGPFRHYITSNLASELTNLHHIVFNIILVLVATHILAVMWHELVKGERLVWSMITGKKKLHQEPPNLFYASGRRIVISFILSVIIVLALVTLF